MINKILFGGDSDRNIGLLIGRVYLGLMFAFAHGYGKIFGGMKHVEAIKSHGMPLPELLGWLSALSEFAGGILIALGLLTRVSSFFLVATMAVAGFVIHGSDPFQVREFAFVYLALSLIYMCKGAGKWSVDYFLRDFRSAD